MKGSKTACAELWSDDAGVIHIRFLPGAVVTRQAVLELVEARQHLVGDAVLVDARQIAGANRDAMQSSSLNRGSAAVAMVVGNPVSVFVGNFFLRLYRPAYACRLFRDVDSAHTWLLSQVGQRGTTSRTAASSEEGT